MGDKIGVVHGRFQPFHLDHLKYILVAKSLCDHIIVGITNPDPTLTHSDEANPQRSLTSANPLTFYQRLVMIRESLIEAGFPYAFFDLVPFPINKPSLIKYYIPLDATFFITIYDEWGYRKKQLLDSLGFDVVVLWEKNPDEKGITSTDIRLRISQNLPWEHLLPNAAVQVMRRLNLESKIRQSNYSATEEYAIRI